MFCDELRPELLRFVFYAERHHSPANNLVCVIILTVGWLAPAWAQDGTVNGRVLGKDGQVKVNTWVQFVKVDTPENYIAMTDEKGRYFLNQVKPGQYRVLITERKNVQNMMKRIGPGTNQVDLTVNW